MTVAVAVRPRQGTSHCGDAACHWRVGAVTVLLIADGLGHGLEAERAAQAAVAFVAGQLARPLSALFADCDRALAQTRGVAMGVARIDADAGVAEYAAVGSVCGILVATPLRRLISAPGIVGGGYRRLCVESAPIRSGQRLILHTDGLARVNRVALEAAEATGAIGAIGATEDDTARLARGLLDALGKSTDDCAVLVYRHGGSRDGSRDNWHDGRRDGRRDGGAS